MRRASWSARHVLSRLWPDLADEPQMVGIAAQLNRSASDDLSTGGRPTAGSRMREGRAAKTAKAGAAP